MAVLSPLGGPLLGGCALTLALGRSRTCGRQRNSCSSHKLLSILKGFLQYGEGNQRLKELAAVQGGFTEEASSERGLEG